MATAATLAIGHSDKTEVQIVAAFAGKATPTLPNWPSAYKSAFQSLQSAKHFKAKVSENLSFSLPNGTHLLVWGLGSKTDYTREIFRRQLASAFEVAKNVGKVIGIDLGSFALKGNMEEATRIAAEAIGMTDYRFDKYKQEDKKSPKKTATLVYLQTKTGATHKKTLTETLNVVDCIRFCRDLVNEPPNVLNSETYAKRIEADAKTLPRTRLKILGKAELKREKMGMFLSVNAGSAYQPRLVHLTYTPARSGKNTKHVALVGKGLTFDTGGYSIKPSNAIINMKFDMAGSATVYAAFRAAAMLELNVKVSCFLGITDNAINEHATMPDSIVRARNGKTVEILNTDAEGRLVLGDVLSYACDQKPNTIIDAATLTGAVLISLGQEVCGVMGNNAKLLQNLKKSAEAMDEYLWELPIIQEFRDDMKSECADLKNIGSSRFAGTPKAAAFLEYFVDKNIPWAHLDIAGAADAQAHLPYCPKKGASGLIVRTLVHYLANIR